MKTYRHLNARIFNENSGTCSRIIDAIPCVRGWNLKAKSEISGHVMDWTTRDIWRCNRIVDEAFKLKQKPFYGRAKRLLRAAEKESFQPRFRFFVSICYGRDSITISRFFRETSVSMHLYGSDNYSLKGEGADKAEAMSKLRALVAFCGMGKGFLGQQK